MSKIEVGVVKIFLIKYVNLFIKFDKDMGRIGFVKYSIDIGDYKFIKEVFRWFLEYMNIEVEKYVKEMLENKIIEFLNSFWVFRVVFVKKKDGFIWFCVDYRCLNVIIEKDVYLILCIDEILD